MRSRSSSTSGSPRNTEAGATCASTTRIRETEEAEFVEAIKEDVRWLGFDWGEHLYHAADYFGQMYGFAEQLIRNGKAYVDSQDEAAIRESRGTVTEPGIPGPDRQRPVEENLTLFRGMRDGAFGEGEYVLRAKIDLAAPNMLMRDPILYRIRHASHYRSGDEWCIYPMYDYAHCLEDAIEEVTHSFCTLEFENNRELYDWILDELGFGEPRPHQYEFGKGLINYTVTSKRKLLRLVRAGLVAGWDDPRLPTLTALRRRGVPPEALLAFWGRVGVARADARIDVGTLEFAIRDELNRKAPRVFAVLDPLKVVLTDWEPGADAGPRCAVLPPRCPARRDPGHSRSPGSSSSSAATSRRTLPRGSSVSSRAARSGSGTGASSGACVRSAMATAGSRSFTAPTIRTAGTARREAGGACRERSTGCRRGKPCRARSVSTTVSSAFRIRMRPPRPAGRRAPSWIS